MKLLPQQLLESLRALPGFNETAFVEAHSEENKITSIRLNPYKQTELDFELNSAVKWCSNAFYLNQRPSFTHDPLFHAGCYYVQEAGSMFLEHALKSVLDFSQPLKVLDLCAAPGGKSTLINSLLNSQSLLIANEISKPRSEILSQNLSKWGTCNTIVTNSDPSRFSSLPAYFDALVIDAPCSGSGLFRKQPDAIDEWSTDNVNMCSSRQKRILADILPSLKEGGFLIYSTCSYSVEEDEHIVGWLENEFNLEYIPVPIKPDWGIVETEAGYRFYPHLTQSEGFFCAVLRKKQSEEGALKPGKFKEFTLSKAEADVLSGFIDVKSHHFYKNNTRFHLLNPLALEFVSVFGKSFYLKKAGVILGEIKGKDLVPDQELAWSNDLKTEKRLDLPKTDGLKYLRKESFETMEKPSGFSLISYKNQALGWAKVLPGRINNYLPNELRILN